MSLICRFITTVCLEQGTTSYAPITLLLIRKLLFAILYLKSIVSIRRNFGTGIKIYANHKYQTKTNFSIAEMTLFIKQHLLLLLNQHLSTLLQLNHRRSSQTQPPALQIFSHNHNLHHPPLMFLSLTPTHNLSRNCHLNLLQEEAAEDVNGPGQDLDDLSTTITMTMRIITKLTTTKNRDLGAEGRGLGLDLDLYMMMNMKMNMMLEEDADLEEDLIEVTMTAGL